MARIRQGKFRITFLKEFKTTLPLTKKYLLKLYNYIIKYRYNEGKTFFVRIFKTFNYQHYKLNKRIKVKAYLKFSKHFESSSFMFKVCKTSDF